MNFRGITLRGKWAPAESGELRQVMAPLPRGWVEENPNFRVLIRESVLTGAPPNAPGHSKYDPKAGAIVVYDKGVYHGGRLDPEQFRRSIYHELAHSLIKSNPSILRRWAAETNGDGFVDDYAKTSPHEDFADTLSEVLIHNGPTHKAVPRKAAFIQSLLGKPEEKIAMHFLSAFTEEITKTANVGGGLKKMVELATRAGRSGGGKALMGGTAGLGAGAMLGERHGEKEGYGKGTKDLVGVARKARRIGQQEGIMAYHQHMQRRMRAAGKR